MYIYQEKILDNLNEIIKKEEQNIEKAKDMFIETIDNKNSIYVFGASHAGILTQELFYRAGGLAIINPVFSAETVVNTSPISKTSKMEQLEGYGKIIFDSTDLKKGDLLILHSVSGRNPVVIDFALEAAKCGVKILAITNISYSKSVLSRHSSGKKLYEISDLTIDNHGIKGDAAVEVGDRMVGPTSTVTSAFIMNTIISEVAIEMKENNQTIPVFYSANLDDTNIKNKMLVKEYKNMIHYKF